MRKMSVSVLILLALAFLTACASKATVATPDAVSTIPAATPTKPAAEAADYPEINIEAHDFSYTTSGMITAGWVRVKLSNAGAEPHHVQFLRLNDGVTVEQFQEALSQGEGPALALVQLTGGIGTIAPGGEAQAILNLPQGEYVILCFVPSPSDQTPHFVKGMLQTLSVGAASAEAPGEPTADLTVHLRDFAFEMPVELPAGATTVQVINDGPEFHELNLFALEEGKTIEDVRQYLANPNGPPPFRPVGGMNGLDPAKSGYMELNLAPGKYVAICNIPSPQAQGQPHFMLGMMQEFSVK